MKNILLYCLEIIILINILGCSSKKHITPPKLNKIDKLVFEYDVNKSSVIFDYKSFIELVDNYRKLKANNNKCIDYINLVETIR